MTAPNEDTPHFLGEFKRHLDEVFGHSDKDNGTTLHICIEASHPSELGRPSKLISDLLMSQPFLRKNLNRNDDIRVHFIKDRLSVPQLEGHVLAVGGPRSNVISRIAMEYEMEFQSDTPFYRRYSGVTFPLDYVHIHRRDYNGRLFADMASLDGTSRRLIYHYYKALGGEKARERELNLFSVNRHVHHRGLHRLPSLSANLGAGRPSDFVIYDHFMETILPNVFSRRWDKYALVICHGLRDLGTFTSLYRLQDPGHLSEFRERLELLKDAHEACERGQIPGALESGWSVVRPLETLDHLEGVIKTDTNIWKDQIDHVLNAQGGEKNRFEFVNDKSDNMFLVRPHIQERASTSPIPKASVVAFQENIETNYFGSNSTGSSSFKIDRINEQQILDAMSVPRDKHFRRHEIYALGCFERKKTVYTQQARALTLIHALCKARKIKKGTKIAIVGGGVSGITAAIAAAKTGARVVLCEKEKRLIPIQSDCTHRWLHPFFYDWPTGNSFSNTSDLPLDEHLNWSAGPANVVFEALIEKFEAFKVEHNRNGDHRELTVYNNFPVRMLLFDRTNGKHIICKRSLKRENRGAEMLLSDDDDVQGDAFINGLKTDDQGQPIDDYLDWMSEWKTAASLLVRQIQQGQSSEATTTMLRHDEFVECDILIFATGFGEEDPQAWLDLEDKSTGKKPIALPSNPKMLLNKSYWKPDQFRKPRSRKNARPIYVVSGAGDGALIDILRLCIKEFERHEWHRDFIDHMTRVLEPEQSGAIWSNKRDVLVFAHELKRLFRSDGFRLQESEKQRLSQIEQTMTGFDIDAFLDEFEIELNDVEVYNVDMEVQPFWADACVAHQLLIWCLHKKGHLRFIRGTIEAYGKVPRIRKDKPLLTIRRHLTGKARHVQPEGVVIRHGVGDQPSGFLDLQGLLIDMPRSAKEIAGDARRLVSLLKLSTRLHPETEKFFRHTVNHLR